MKVFHAARSVGLKSCSPAGGSKELSGISTPCFEFEVDATLHATDRPHSGLLDFRISKKNPFSTIDAHGKTIHFWPSCVGRPHRPSALRRASINSDASPWVRGNGAAAPAAMA